MRFREFGPLASRSAASQQAGTALRRGELNDARLEAHKKSVTFLTVSSEVLAEVRDRLSLLHRDVGCLPSDDAPLAVVEVINVGVAPIDGLP